MTAIEQQLFLPPPRKARPRSGEGSHRWLLLVALASALSVGYVAYTEWVFATYGRVMPGQVIACSKKWGLKWPLLPAHRYYVVYTYEGMPLTTTSASARVDEYLWEELKIGQRITVTYLPYRPGASRVGRPEEMSFLNRLLEDWRAGYAMVLLVVLPLWAAHRTLRLRRDFHLVRYGRAAKAQIVDMKAVPMDRSRLVLREYRYVVRYRFQSPDGREVTGRHTLSEDDADRVWHMAGQLGLDAYRSHVKDLVPRMKDRLKDQEVIVLFDPYRPRRNAIYSLMAAELDSREYEAAGEAVNNGRPE